MSWLRAVTDLSFCLFITVKYKEPIYFRAHCSATVTTVLYLPSLEDHPNPVAANRPGSPSTSTVVLDREKLHFASLGVHSNFAATNSPWAYFTDIDPTTEVS